jgi:hypothetical protein
MMPRKQLPEIKLTPLRGKLKLKDVARAVREVRALREAEERARARRGRP